MVMSILELIQTAEEKAEKMRQNANEQVKELLETTKINSEAEAKKMHLQAEKDLKALEIKFNEMINKEQINIDQKATTEDNLMVKDATKRFDAAIDFVLKKVLVK